MVADWLKQAEDASLKLLKMTKLIARDSARSFPPFSRKAEKWNDQVHRISGQISDAKRSFRQIAKGYDSDFRVR